ncbi:hypothetical protein D3C71_1671020 [compost metagenome]
MRMISSYASLRLDSGASPPKSLSRQSSMATRSYSLIATIISSSRSSKRSLVSPAGAAGAASRRRRFLPSSHLALSAACAFW